MFGITVRCALLLIRLIKTHFFHNSYFTGLHQMQNISGSEPDDVTHLCMKQQYT